MVAIPGGTFVMGAARGEPGATLREQPRHPVNVPAFMLAAHEVTRGEYADFVAATGRMASGCQIWDGRSVSLNDDAGWDSPGYLQDDAEPVACISWRDAEAYAAWLAAETGIGFRLPSEAEWEYAARAGTETPFFWGDRPHEGCGHANMADETAEAEAGLVRTVGCTDGFAYTAPVGSLAPNPFGLHDMLGNVAEWVADCWHDDYIVSPPNDGSAWMSGDCTGRVARGGSWSAIGEHLRAAARTKGGPDTPNNLIGFRLARDL